ncbi:hypothetical protein RCH06_002160 [Polaromonas sp. CG_9.5]|uniref:hypothetical protein n=1 Tax=Polaromonas sp. CG_9.5 TaxID=3071705 RepID=UPI002E08A9B8|nr:hypothetical protein [Polaromonas sp. CG_9.5]
MPLLPWLPAVKKKKLLCLHLLLQWWLFLHLLKRLPLLLLLPPLLALLLLPLVPLLLLPTLLPTPVMLPKTLLLLLVPLLPLLPKLLQSNLPDFVKSRLRAAFYMGGRKSIFLTAYSRCAQDMFFTFATRAYRCWHRPPQCH